MKNIPLIKPYVNQQVKDSVCRVLDSGYLTEGAVTRAFEKAIAAYIGCRCALAVSNCTVGLETALRAINIGPGDEVVVPDYTYPATAAVVQIVGAKIVVVDIDRDSMLIDYGQLEKALTSRTKAVIPVSIFGNPLDYERLNRIKKRYRLSVIEDAACSIGAGYDGRRVGSLADISVFSLHPRKFVTTGEGGVITTDDNARAKWMQSYTHFGMSAGSDRHGIHFERIGTNYKLSNIQAAVGLQQMHEIDTLLRKRVELAERYLERLGNVPGITFPRITEKGIHSWQSFCVFVPNRDHIIRRLKEKNIETQIGSYALHMHRAFNRNPGCRFVGEMSASRYAYDHCLTLPLYHEMTEKEQDYVVDHLVESLKT